MWFQHSNSWHHFFFLFRFMSICDIYIYRWWPSLLLLLNLLLLLGVLRQCVRVCGLFTIVHTMNDRSLNTYTYICRSPSILSRWICLILIWCVLGLVIVGYPHTGTNKRTQTHTYLTQLLINTCSLHCSTYV